jgi:hypothetical protein
MCRTCSESYGDEQHAVGTTSTPATKDELKGWLDHAEFELKGMRHRRAGFDLEIEAQERRIKSLQKKIESAS